MDFKVIQSTPLYHCFSELGKRIFLPDGIFYWGGRAKQEAEIIGTIGAAFSYEKDFIENGSENWVPSYLKEIKNTVNFDIKDLVPYVSIGGLSEIRNLWKEWIIKKSSYSRKNDRKKLEQLQNLISNPIVTAGVTNAIYTICSMFLDSNEYIICPNKRWGNYDNIIKKNIGAKIRSFEFFKNQNLNLEAIKDAIIEVSKNQEKIVLILNFPNNPTGYVPKEIEKRKLITLLQDLHNNLKKPFIILIDDAYEPFVHSENAINRSIFYDLQLLEEDIIPIKLDGITKELLIYGGRIGFITIGLKQNWIANSSELDLLKKEINNKLEGFTRSTISNCNHFYQTLTINLLRNNGMDSILESRKKIQHILKERYLKINQELKKIQDHDISIDPNGGGFFVFLNISPKKIGAEDFADILLKDYNVGVIPIQNLQENINGIRIAYSSIDLEQIEECVNRINQALIKI